MALINPFENEPVYVVAYRIVDTLGSRPNRFQIAGKVASRHTLELEILNDKELIERLVEAPDWYASAISAHIREAGDRALHETDEWNRRLFETFTSGGKTPMWGRFGMFNADMVRSNLRICQQTRVKDEDRERQRAEDLRALEVLGKGATMSDVWNPRQGRGFGISA